MAEIVGPEAGPGVEVVVVVMVVEAEPEVEVEIAESALESGLVGVSQQRPRY